MSKKPKIPSPCIDVCKFKREGHCIGCSMTKVQKKIFKRLKKPEQQAAFVDLIRIQQAQLGKYGGWPMAYDRKLRKAGKQALRPAA